MIFVRKCRERRRLRTPLGFRVTDHPPPNIINMMLTPTYINTAAVAITELTRPSLDIPSSNVARVCTKNRSRPVEMDSISAIKQLGHAVLGWKRGSPGKKPRRRGNVSCPTRSTRARPFPPGAPRGTSYPLSTPERRRHPPGERGCACRAKACGLLNVPRA